MRWLLFPEEETRNKHLFKKLIRYVMINVISLTNLTRRARIQENSPILFLISARNFVCIFVEVLFYNVTQKSLAQVASLLVLYGICSSLTIS
jgi:hypothetical protein